MKAILISLTLISFTSIAHAQTNCSYAEVSNIVSFEDDSLAMSARSLSKDEIKLLQNYVDDSWNCDEGVELIGPEKTEQGASYKAVCFADSLGAATVSLTLTCE